ncbi:MAG TPA: glycosyltransferase family 2 protein [Terriglobales bacterium]|nr:glycosyltransferase family 2 protein [Terriglobales bacterium]
MKWLFWWAAVTIAYTYFGYAGWLWLRSHWRRVPVRTASYTPFASIVMVVRNEASVVEDKLRNLMNLDYPEDRYEILVTSDGSNDGTNQILSRYSSNHRIRVIVKPQSQGKAAGLNDAVLVAKGDLVVFTDARQKIEPAAVRLLAENFAGPTIGCASGELMLGDPQIGEVTTRMGLYWRVEKRIRELESASGSVVGATGALYAVRRSLLVPIPPGTILDDVYIPMNVVRQGYRVVFDSRARAWDLGDQGRDREFARKVRTLSGNYQLLQLAPWLLSSENSIRFEFVSHKLLRLIAPFALLTVLVTSLFIHDSIYRAALALQLGFYGLCIIAKTRLARGAVARIADAAFTFVVLNTAAAVAFARFVTGRRVVWGG